MSQVIDDFKTAVENAFTVVQSSFDTIAADQAKQVTALQDLQTVINGSLSSADQQSLAQVVADAQALANKAQAAAAAMPVIPDPGTGGTGGGGPVTPPTV